MNDCTLLRVRLTKPTPLPNMPPNFLATTGRSLGPTSRAPTTPKTTTCKKLVSNMQYIYVGPSGEPRLINCFPDAQEREAKPRQHVALANPEIISCLDVLITCMIFPSYSLVQTGPSSACFAAARLQQLKKMNVTIPFATGSAPLRSQNSTQKISWNQGVIRNREIDDFSSVQCLCVHSAAIIFVNWKVYFTNPFVGGPWTPPGGK
jgi:hypothetical protein